MKSFLGIYRTRESILAAFGPQNFSAIAHTPLHLPAQKTPTLLDIQRIYGAETLAVIVKHFIHHLQTTLMQEDKMELPQIENLAARMCEAYNGIEAGELVSFFWHLECGDYPAGFGCIDPVKIMESLGKFYRNLVRERVSVDARRDAEEACRRADENERNAVSREDYERIFLKDPAVRMRVEDFMLRNAKSDADLFRKNWLDEFKDVPLYSRTKKPKL